MPIRQERRRLTIFFSDIVGFTDIADELEPEDTSRLLNEYVAAVAEVADRSGAALNQIIGDGLLVVFGAPVATNDQDHALRAVGMALAMQQRTPALRDRWKQQGLEKAFAVRMGINTAYATVGDFGSEGAHAGAALSPRGPARRVLRVGLVQPVPRRPRPLRRRGRRTTNRSPRLDRREVETRVRASSGSRPPARAPSWC
jgi:class 3 adenylate cyclase